MADRTNISQQTFARAVITVSNATIKAAPNPGLIGDLIPGVPNQVIVPVSISFQNKFTAANWANTGQVGIFYKNGFAAGHGLLFSESALFGAIFGASKGRVSNGNAYQTEVLDTECVGSALSLYQTGALGAGGDGTFVITIDYELLPA